MRRFVLAALAAVALAAAPSAQSQTFPSKPVRLVVPFPPGGATDIIGRLLAANLQETWGQTVVVDNKPGAGSVLGTDMVAKSAADGYTMGVVVTAHVINPSLRANMPYDTLRDLSGVGQIAQAHIVLAANPSFAAGSVAELVALARKSPGQIAYASPGSGSALHLGMELFKSAAGIDLVHVPYKGGPPATQDVLGGRVPLLADLHFAAAPLLKSGKLKPIALLSPRRPASAPDIPVIAETYPAVAAVSIYGVVVPSATPRDIVRKLGADVAAAVKTAAVAERMQQQGIEPVTSSPEQFDALIRAEVEKWAQVVKASGAKAD
jgi:tripartite-type tricarboxylate transporter receptor subunit TctC